MKPWLITLIVCASVSFVIIIATIIIMVLIQPSVAPILPGNPAYNIAENNISGYPTLEQQFAVASTPFQNGIFNSSIYYFLQAYLNGVTQSNTVLNYTASGKDQTLVPQSGITPNAQNVIGLVPNSGTTSSPAYHGTGWLLQQAATPTAAANTYEIYAVHGDQVQSLHLHSIQGGYQSASDCWNGAQGVHCQNVIVATDSNVANQEIYWEFNYVGQAMDNPTNSVFEVSQVDSNGTNLGTYLSFTHGYLPNSDCYLGGYTNCTDITVVNAQYHHRQPIHWILTPVTSINW